MSTDMPPDITTAAVYLETAALAFAAARETPEPFAGSRDWLATTALAFAAASGSLNASERAELSALRRFRDGIASLRAELANEPKAVALVLETVDALFALSYPRMVP